MNKQSKKAYQAPTVKVVEVKVEHAFQSQFNAINTSANPQNGTETYEAGGTTNGWF